MIFLYEIVYKLELTDYITFISIIDLHNVKYRKDYSDPLSAKIGISDGFLKKHFINLLQGHKEIHHP